MLYIDCEPVARVPDVALMARAVILSDADATQQCSAHSCSVTKH